MKKISVIVPVYNNQGSIKSLFSRLEDLAKKIRSIGMDLEVICVDDGSADNSLETLIENRPSSIQTTVIKHSKNFGEMSAFKTGIKHATGDCFTELAADLQDPPELILPMAKKWLNGSVFTICERTDREDPMLSKLLSKAYYKVLRKISISSYPPGGYDMALMDNIFKSHILKSSKNTFIPILAFRLGFKPQIIKYKRKNREHGTSQWTFRKKINAAFNNIMGTSMLPLRFISLTGITVAGISFLYGMSIIIETILSGVEVPGFASIAVLLSFLNGMILCLLGVIGEYIWRLYDDINGIEDGIVEKIL